MFTAQAEPGDEEAVTRAKYFIRDEFLVSDCFLCTKCPYLTIMLSDDNIQVQLRRTHHVQLSKFMPGFTMQVMK